MSKAKVNEEENVVVSEIDEMLKTFGAPEAEESSDESKAKEAQEEDETSEEETEEEKKTKEGELEAKSEEDEDGDAEKKKSDSEDSSEESEESAEEPDKRDEVIASLEQRLSELEKSPEEEKEKKEEETSIEELTFEPQDFVGDSDVDDIFQDKDSINALLGKVYEKGVTDSRNIVGDHVLRGIPDIVKANISLMSELQESRDQFYKDNPDLEAFPRVVAAVFEEVASSNPDKGYKNLLDEVGKEARNRLDLHKEATKTLEIKDGDNKDGDKPPKLPKKKGTRTSKDQPDVKPLEAEIGDMNESIGR